MSVVRTPRSPAKHGNRFEWSRIAAESSTRLETPVSEGTSRTAMRRDAICRRLLAVADVAAVIAATIFALSAAGQGAKTAALLAVPAVVVVAKILGLYDRDELLLRKTTLDEAPALLGISTGWTLMLWATDAFSTDRGTARTEALLLFGSMFVMLLLTRAVARWVGRKASPPERCLVIGDEDTAARIRDKFAIGGGVKAEVVACVPSAAAPAKPTDSEFGHDGFNSLLTQLEVDRVVIAPGFSDGDEVLDVIRAVKSVGAKVTVLPRMLEVIGSTVEFDDLNGLPMLGVRRFGLSKSSRAIKRALDLAGSTVGLLLVAPLMGFIAVAIKLDSRGTVLFRQTRIGRDGEPFQILKFRTMIPEADRQKEALRDLNEADGLFKIEKDPRITRVGSVLRRLSLDEFPQLFNVLRGDMSLVGPRPLVAEDDRRVEGWHRRRLHLTPGMTGHWQILGSSRVPLNEMVAIDYLYVANWSLWADVKILLRTIPYMLGARGL